MSRDLRETRVIIYPAYLDANLTRKKGRRVPLQIAIHNPSLEEIFNICKALGLNPELEPDKVYPRNISMRGRIVVDKRGSKLKTLYLIASELKKRYQKSL